MDWKVLPGSTDFHKSKDVAAFSNHRGGTLLIGAKETATTSQLECYVGLDLAAAAAVRSAYSTAVRDRCQPLPQFDFEEYVHPDDDTKRVVAVNVWPSLLLIGVRVDAHKPAEGYGGVSWVYPVRSGTDAVFLQPSQLAMYMTPHVRRVAVMLSRIPKGARIIVKLVERDHSAGASIDEVIEEQNVVTLRGDDGRRVQSLPLDCIVSVYESWEPNANANKWYVLVQYTR
jgi:hypothetical protein